MKKFLSLILLFGILFGAFPKNSFAEDKRIYEIEKKIENLLNKKFKYYNERSDQEEEYYEEEIIHFRIHNDDYYMFLKNNKKCMELEIENINPKYNCHSLVKNGEKILDNLRYYELRFLNGNYYLFDDHYYNTRYGYDDIDSYNSYIKNGEKITSDSSIYGDNLFNDIYALPSKIYQDNYNLQVKEDGIYKNDNLIISTTSLPNIINVDGNDIYYSLEKENQKKLYKNNGEVIMDNYIHNIHFLKNGEKIYSTFGTLYKDGEVINGDFNDYAITGNDIYSYKYDLNKTLFVKKNGSFELDANRESDYKKDVVFKISLEDYSLPYYGSGDILTANSKGDFYIGVNKNENGKTTIFKNGKTLSESIKEYEEKLKNQENLEFKKLGSAPNPEDLVLKNDDRVKVLDYFKNNSEEKVENKIEEEKSEIKKNLEKIEEKNISENKEISILNSDSEKTTIKTEEKTSEKTEIKKEEIKYLEDFYFDKEIPEEIEEEKTDFYEKISENEEKKGETKMNNLKITRLPKTGPLEIFLIILSLTLTFGIFKFRKRKI